jgi:hypothetical protein
MRHPGGVLHRSGEAASLLDCGRASIFLLDRERNELWSKVALGSDEILRFDARLRIAGSAALTSHATIAIETAQSIGELREEIPRIPAAADNQQQASRLLGLSRQGLIDKIKRYAIARAGQ